MIVIICAISARQNAAAGFRGGRSVRRMWCMHGAMYGTMYGAMYGSVCGVCTVHRATYGVTYELKRERP